MHSIKLLHIIKVFLFVIFLKKIIRKKITTLLYSIDNQTLHFIIRR